MIRPPWPSPRPPTLALVVVALLAFVLAWSTGLVFSPVPWPDDSAFYFVAKELFRWPPRWVMLPQAPFEPSYATWNFNTMPLYPILIGLGRFIGLDDVFGVRVWPLLFWAVAGALLPIALFRAGLTFFGSLLLALLYFTDPGLRWASTLARPESLIGLLGITLVLGLTLGYPRSLRPRGAWDPSAACLALGAYAHFNAVYLVPVVVAALAHRPRRVVRIGAITALYLAPWLVTVALKPRLFWEQMSTQWARLAVGNGWLQSWNSALMSWFQGMGLPEPWHPWIRFAALFGWAASFLAALGVIFGLFWTAFPRLRFAAFRQARTPTLVPAGAWLLSSLWLWHSKPEVWFTAYMHFALWTWVGLLALKLWRSRGWRPRPVALPLLAASSVGVLFLFALVSGWHYLALARSPSWTRESYRRWADCVDHRLQAVKAKLAPDRGLRVWGPTFPDILIELDRRHPDWELSRTNDFYFRNEVALEHGRSGVDAVVVTEMLNPAERRIDAPQSEHPEIQSVWMNWRDYYLHRLTLFPGFKPDRWLCQEGRWQAFIYSD